MARMRTSKPAKWFRMYAEFASDPKVQMLSEVDQRRFIMLLCLRCCNGDVTLHDDEVAFQLRISNDEWASTKAVLIAKNLIDEDCKPCAWDKRQYASDDVAERVSRHREKLKRPCNVTVTPPETETETETENRGKPSPASDKPMRGASVASASDIGFERFWQRWPKKVGKQAAVKAWQKVKPDPALQVRILAAVDRLAADPQARAEGWQFVPEPCRWLSGKRWEDAPPMVAERYADAELAVISAYNAVLSERGWPCAVTTPFSTDRAASIRAFLGFGSRPDWVENYFSWLADNLPPKEGYGFDWAVKRESYLRAKEGNFAALREATG